MNKEQPSRIILTDSAVDYMPELPPFHQREVASGVANLGNTCYMNSILECVRFMPDLRSALPVGMSSDDRVVLSSDLRATLDGLDRYLVAIPH